MSKVFSTILIGCASILCVFAAGVSSVYAGTLSVSSPSKVKVGDEFRVTISASDTAKIDTVRVRGTFSADLLEWRGVSADDLPNVSPGNSVNQAAGSFTFGAFTLNGGLNRGVISVIRFRAKKEGIANVTLLGSSLMLAAGENSLTSAGSARIEIISDVPEPQEPPKPVFDIKLSSPTNPVEDRWSNSGTVSIVWRVINGAGKPVYMDIGDDPQLNPTTQVTTSPVQFNVEGDDGIYYVRARSTSADNKSLIKTFRVLLDRTPPRAFAPGLEIDPASPATNWVIRYASLDSGSGISKYEIFINDQKIAETPGTQNVLSYEKSKLAGQEVRVIAYDAAGNKAEGRITAPEDRLVTTIVTEQPPQIITRPFIPDWIWGLLIGLMLLILFLLFKRKKDEQKQEKQAKTKRVNKRKSEE